MFKIVLKSALALTIAGTGLVALTSSPSFAGKPTITAGPGSSVNCTITGSKATVTPPLVNDWTKTSSDFYNAINALPNTYFANQVTPSTTNAAGKGTCTGIATDGVSPVSVTSFKFTVVTDPAAPGSAPSTCATLLSPGTALYNVGITWKGTGGIVNPTTVTGATLSSQLSPIGFVFSGGTVTGSFGGGAVNAVGLVNSSIEVPLLQAAETGPEAVAKSWKSAGCQPSLAIVVNKHIAGGTGNPDYITSATLNAPKGLKKLPLVPGGTLTASR